MWLLVPALYAPSAMLGECDLHPPTRFLRCPCTCAGGRGCIYEG